MALTVLKGNIVSAPALGELTITEHGYLAAEDGTIIGVFPALPEAYAAAPVEDWGDALILQSFADLHLHAPQYPMMAMGMDLPLLDWLEAYAFPTETRCADEGYARELYRRLAHDLVKNGTTRVSIFSSLHRPATLILMEELERAGVRGYVGKVNMDRNGGERLQETTEESERETLRWLEECQDFRGLKPILTPRFTPSCTDALMAFLGNLAQERDLPVQSHLSENYGEITWVQELCPESQFYGDAYDQFGLFGKDCRTIMAHCVHSGPQEIERMKENGVFIAHCPESNTNLSSGVAPVRTYLQEGMHVGIGSDVAGGTTENLFAAMRYAIQSSKLRWRLKDDTLAPLTMTEVFYMTTKGGGEFFGKVGSFEPEYEFDAVVLDDSRLKHPQEMSISQRLERMIYLADEREVYAKYVAGEKIYG